MSKKVLILSTSPRRGSNSEALAEAFAGGAREAGHEVELIALRGKDLRFCQGCFACQKTGKCVIKDDMQEIVPKMEQANVLVFATPIYYYEMRGPCWTGAIRCSWRTTVSATCICSPPPQRTRILSRSARSAVWRAGSSASPKRGWPGPFSAAA